MHYPHTRTLTRRRALVILEPGKVFDKKQDSEILKPPNSTPIFEHFDHFDNMSFSPTHILYKSINILLLLNLCEKTSLNKIYDTKRFNVKIDHLI